MIPAAVLTRLGLTAPGRITFTLKDDGVVEVRAAPVRVEELRGIVPALPNRETGDFDDLIAEG